MSITLNLTNNDLFLFGCGADFFFFLSVKKYYLIFWCLKAPIHKPKNIFKWQQTEIITGCSLSVFDIYVQTKNHPQPFIYLQMLKRCRVSCFVMFRFAFSTYHCFHFYIAVLFPFYSKLKKLSEDSLTKQPEEVFDVLEKLGEG